MDDAVSNLINPWLEPGILITNPPLQSAVSTALLAWLSEKAVETAWSTYADGHRAEARC